MSMEYLPNSQSIESIEEEVIYKKVPWISWDEWNFVRKSLFSSSPQSIAAALDRISMWKTRGSLPIVVDVTASIIRNQQKDPKFRKDLNCDTMNQEELASLYCIHIIRLVNGVVDQDRNKRGKKDKRELSINEAANEIGLPRMLIDIRHEASHRDSPSLQLVRQASVKALDWMRSYYWDPQMKAIPIQRDTVEFVRKRVIAKLSELAFHLDAYQDSQLGSLPMKRKRNKHSNIALRCCSSFSHKVKKLQGSHSQGPKNQTKRILRILFRLYTSFPLEVVSVLLDFLQKALDSSVDDGVEPFIDSELGPDSELSKAQTRTTDVCKLVITRLSRKEPELILIMLKAVLEKLETEETTKFKNGSESRGEIRQTEELSSLVLWLIQRYNKIKHSGPEECGDEIYNSSGEGSIIPKVALKGLLKKCLLVSSLDNNHLARSALLLAQIMGNHSVIEKVTKLTVIFSGDVGCTSEECPEMLEVLKGRLDKDDNVASNDDVGKNEGKWTVAKMWNPCPIGMLPGSLGSMGIHPILDRVIDLPDIVQNVPESEDIVELDGGDETVYDDHDDEFLEKMDDTEEMGAVVNGGYEGSHLLVDPFKRRLMIGGVYKKVYSDEFHVIENAVRILV